MLRVAFGLDLFLRTTSVNDFNLNNPRSVWDDKPADRKIFLLMPRLNYLFL